VPEFEYDFGSLPETLHFVGLLPMARTNASVPDWWATRDRSKRIVLVTQGTLANAEFGQVVEPTLQALAHRDDLLVIATTGGRPISALTVPIPANARVERFLPFGEILPEIDLLVTNGGYGSVCQALSAGSPIVSAGLSEDKAEVSARIGWSGAGINLATNTPHADALRKAVTRVLDEPSFRQQAAALRVAFAARDAMTGILGAIDDLARTGSVLRGGTSAAVPLARSA